MPAPDTREWYSKPYSELFNGEDLLPTNTNNWQRECIEDFKKSHTSPETKLLRITFLKDPDNNLVWICLESWNDSNPDQGPEPTINDIPKGFV